jgi:SAM-dependent methyltransferase
MEDLWRRYNLNQLQRFEAVLNRHGRSLRAFPSIFDFGCGDGRLAQYLFTLAPGARVCGSDVRSEVIDACRRKHPQGRFLVNRPTPPLAIEDEAFDLIYSYSVFTHLTEPNHKAWLRELTRMLKPGGVMLHTVHSYEYLRRAAFFSPESLKKYAVVEPPEAFMCAGRDYLYVVEDPAAPEYGYTVMRKEYVLETWPRESGLTLLDYVEGAIESYPEGCQDVVLLAKPGG